MTIQLHQGRYGSAEIINSFSSSWYRELDIPAPRLWASQRIHPFAEHMLSNDRSPNLDTSLLEGAYINSASDLFDRSHPLDKQMSGLAAQWVGQIGTDLSETESRWVEAVDRAIKLLETYVPDAWSSTVPFVSRVYIARRSPVAGISFDDSLGAFVLGAEKNEDALELVSNFYHESLHCKMARITRSFDPVFPETTAECIPIPWWKGVDGKTHWDVRRCVDALHVYIHLSDFLETWGPESGHDSWRQAQARCAFRASYLGRTLNDIPAGLFGRDWKNFVGWLVDCTPEPTALSQTGWQVLRSARFPNIQVDD